MSRFLVRLFTGLHDILHKPKIIFLSCLVLLFFSLVIQGGLFQIWSLHRDQQILDGKIAKINKDILAINGKIEKVSDPNFLELEVRNQLDYVEKGDLIFVFTETE